MDWASFFCRVSPITLDISERGTFKVWDVCTRARNIGVQGDGMAAIWCWPMIILVLVTQIRGSIDILKNYTGDLLSTSIGPSALRNYYHLPSKSCYVTIVTSVVLKRSSRERCGPNSLHNVLY